MRTRTLMLICGVILLGMLAACAGAPAITPTPGATTPNHSTPAISQSTPGAHGSDGRLTGTGSKSASAPGHLTPTPTPTPSQTASAPAGVTQVDIRDFSFQPAKIQVEVGTTVTWTNRDTTPHTVTFRDDSVRGSDLLQQGQSFSYTFTAAGAYPYYCAPHTYMIGIVTVTR